MLALLVFLLAIIVRFDLAILLAGLGALLVLYGLGSTRGTMPTSVPAAVVTVWAAATIAIVVAGGPTGMFDWVAIVLLAAVIVGSIAQLARSMSRQGHRVQ